MTTRKELVAALQLRYSGAAFGDRIKILDEFVALSGYHRKYAMQRSTVKQCNHINDRTTAVLRSDCLALQSRPLVRRSFAQADPKPVALRVSNR
jgi:hypothetical protein